MTGCPAVKIDAAFAAEARAMIRAMDTGELPPRTAPYCHRVKALADMQWATQVHRLRNGGRP